MGLLGRFLGGELPSPALPDAVPSIAPVPAPSAGRHVMLNLVLDIDGTLLDVDQVTTPEVPYSLAQLSVCMLSRKWASRVVLPLCLIEQLHLRPLVGPDRQLLAAAWDCDAAAAAVKAVSFLHCDSLTRTAPF